MSGDIRGRFESLKTFGEGFARVQEQRIREATGLIQFQCFVHDQFESSFPEEHITQGQSVILFMRLTFDLRGFGVEHVKLLKDRLLPLTNALSFVRPNFGDPTESVDFDWHLTEVERDKDRGEVFANRLLADALTLALVLSELSKDGIAKSQSSLARTSAVLT